MRFIKIESDRVTIVDQAIEDSGVGPYTVEESESGVCIGFVTSDRATHAYPAGSSGARWLEEHGEGTRVIDTKAMAMGESA